MSTRVATVKSGDNRAAVIAAATLARPIENTEYTTADKIWHIAIQKGHIMPSTCAHLEDDSKSQDDCNVCVFRRSVPNCGEFPEMIFDHNRLSVTHQESGASIEWSALDALKCVSASNADPSLQVSASAEWQSSRADVSELSKRSKLYDWTFCTHFDGTLRGFKAEETAEQINLDVLRRREPIAFYGEVPLFEDELADHGAAAYTVRVRCMPSALFVLARYYLRVDAVLARIIDTRVYAHTGDATLLREFSVRELPVAELSAESASLLHKPDELWQHLPEQLRRIHQLRPSV